MKRMLNKLGGKDKERESGYIPPEFAKAPPGRPAGAQSSGTGGGGSGSAPSSQQAYYNPAAAAQQQHNVSPFAPPLGPPPPPQQHRQDYAYPQQQPQSYHQQFVPQQQPGYGGPAYAPAAATVPGVEDPFAALRRYDTVFIVDDSESMEMHWDATMEAMVGVVQKSVQYDEDGIDIYFFNSQVVVQNLRTAQDIRGLFRRVDPRRSTPTARALKRVLEPYLQKLEAAYAEKQRSGQAAPVKPLSIVVLTDGAPDRNEEPEGVIVDAGKRLEAIRAPAFQLGLNFVQIGSDEEAQQALTYLDDHLKTEYGIRDFVDTTLSPTDGRITTEYLLKALLGGVNRKLDKQ